MQNDMRDRLVRLLRADMHTECDKHEDCLECPYQNDEDACYEHLATMCADHLIANGVVLPPCRVGDICYPLPRYRTPIVERKISRITFSQRNIIIGYYENDGQYRPPLRTRILGEDVFLTKDQAEQKLKEMRVENG